MTNELIFGAKFQIQKFVVDSIADADRSGQCPSSFLFFSRISM
jgi:hypothetical protein